MRAEKAWRDHVAAVTGPSPSSRKLRAARDTAVKAAIRAGIPDEEIYDLLGARKSLLVFKLRYEVSKEEQK